MNRKRKVGKAKKPFVYGDPEYSPEEDIYSKGTKFPIPSGTEESDGTGLDVPGSELDDAGEEIGEEDEENNYYSLGGDNHEDLEEAKD